MQWFTLISKELHDSAIVPENIYNIDETGVLLNVLSSLKVLVSKEDLTNYRGAGVRRILITAIECISADGRFLAPLICLAYFHTSEHLDHPPPGWHFACSKTGYTDTQISLYWMQHVFDPSKAGKKPFSIGVNRIDRGFRHDPAAARCDVKSKKILYRC
jgi:hypothetical protein